ncbi:hypothetical protein INR49_028164 [Caranx melampygus]|nr:hypothetical protein INR49_028164 [Caranx melampygus]
MVIILHFLLLLRAGRLNTEKLQKYNVVLFVLCAALALSLIVIAVLIYFIKKKTCDCCKATVSGRTYATTASGHQRRQQRDEDSLTYSTATFTKRKAGKTERADKRQQREKRSTLVSELCDRLTGQTVDLLRKGATKCTDDLIFETKTVEVGDDVKLTCPRQTSDQNIKLFWIRLVSGNSPEFLGGTYSFDYDGVNNTPHITAKQESGAFVLHINDTDLSDTGLYYCMKVARIDLKFVNGTFLRIIGLNTEKLQKYNVVLFVLCAALALSLIVIAVLIYFIKKKTCDCCKATVSGQTYATMASGHQRRQQRDEDSLTYAAPTFTKRKAEKTERADKKTAERETVYTGVRAL